MYEEFSHSTVIPPLIPVSHKFSTFPSHSTVIPLIPLIRFPLISPLIPQFIRFPLILLSFHCHLVSPRSPVIPLIRFLKFPCHSPHSPGFPLLYTQLSLGCSLMVVLSRLSFSSPILSWFSLAIPLFSEEAGQHHRFKGQEGRKARPQGSAPHSQFLSLSPPAVSPHVCISLFVLDPVTGKQGRDWLGKLPNVQEKLCFFMACL